MQDGNLDKAVWGAIPEELLEHNLDYLPFHDLTLATMCKHWQSLNRCPLFLEPIQRIPCLDPNCYNINMSENGSFTGQVTANPQMNGRNLPLLSLPCLAWKKV